MLRTIDVRAGDRLMPRNLLRVVDRALRLGYAVATAAGLIGDPLVAAGPGVFLAFEFRARGERMERNLLWVIDQTSRPGHVVAAAQRVVRDATIATGARRLTAAQKLYHRARSVGGPNGWLRPSSHVGEGEEKS